MSRFLSANSEYVGKAYFVGKIYNIHDYPGAILSTNASERVYGSIYKITNKANVFEVLDRYEGVEEHLFKRITVNAHLSSGDTLKTWVYIYNRSIADKKRIYSGDYLN